MMMLRATVNSRVAPLDQSKVLAKTAMTHRFPIEYAVETFRLAQDKSKGVLRVLVEPS
jgi:hypothetical protein